MKKIFLLIVLIFPLFLHSQVDSNRLKTIAQRLAKAYPDFISGYDNGFLIWKDGTKMLIDDGKTKTFDEKINNPDIEDMFSFEYKAGALDTPTYNYDPGRIRYQPLFKKMYGQSKSEVRKNLDTVYWLPSSLNQKIYITRINGISKQLQEVSNELDKHPEYRKYLENIGGTFNWRYIAGTNRLSPHSFGIAIDINVKYSNYWRWQPQKEKKYVNRIPMGIVEIFEKHGFIWGGKWYHFDTMHFEYRPELLEK